MGKAA
jgi:glucosamine-6-phosphate deaminase